MPDGRLVGPSLVWEELLLRTEAGDHVIGEWPKAKRKE